MKNDLNIYELKRNLLNDLDKWLDFDELDDEEQNEICEAVADKERNNFDYYHDITDDEGIYIEASEKMGYLREDTLTEDQKNLRYNLSYSQGDYAYLEGSYNLHTLLKNNGASDQVLKDLNYLIKKVDCGEWEDYANKCDLMNFYETCYNKRPKGFYIIRNKNHSHCKDTNAEDFIYALQDFKLANGKQPACVKRILQEFTTPRKRQGFNGSAYIATTLIDMAFENYEYSLKHDLYDAMEEWHKQDREYWINEVLRPSLKGKYNRITKEFKRECEKVYKIN
jgi:hypothetical protein